MSSIKALKDFLEKHYKTTKIEGLNDHRIGIEALPWIFKLPVKEPFQITMGGIPLTLLDILGKELDKLKKANIKPFFVFNGLSIIKDRSNIIKSQRLNAAWDLYYRGQYPQAEKAFIETIEKSQLAPYIPYIIAFFKQHGIEFFKAPYLVGPQLAYFSDPTQKSYLNAVYGSPELLLFGVQRLIIDIDFEKGTYIWVDLKTILQELGITHDQFIDACLLCGWEYCAQSPLPFPKDNFRNVCDIVKMNHSGIDTIRNYATHTMVPGLDKYMEQFMKTKTLIQNHLIFYSSCVCEPIYKDIQYPNKLSEINQIFGLKLPNDVYFYISQGVISQQVINNFVSGYLLEPLPQIESEEFRTMLDYMKNLRTKTLGLLASCLNNDLKTKGVKYVRWFEPKELDLYSSDFGYINSLPKKLTDHVKNQIKSKAATQPITFQFIAKTLQEQSVSNSNGSSSTTSTTTTTTTSSTPNDGASSAIKDMDESIYLTIQQSLTIMGYLSPSNQSLTVYAKHLDTVQNVKLQESVILFIELLRSTVLTSEKLHFIPKPNFETHASSLLISRVLSLVPIECDSNCWGGPIDHDLMSFHIITKSLYKTIRNLMELASLANFLTYRVILPPSEYFNFSLKLPFFLQPNVGMGLLVKGILLDNLTFDRLEKIYPNFTNLKADLDLGNEFWEIAMKIVIDLNKSGDVSSNLLKSFQDADQIWKTARKGLQI